MAATALQTFGVTSTVLLAYVPQVDMEGTGDILTSARVTQLVKGPAAKVCGFLIAAGMAPADIAADTSSAAYAFVQDLIARLCVPSVLRAIGAGVTEDATLMYEQAMADLQELKRTPELVGYDADTTLSPSVWATTEDLTDLDDENEVVYRRWGLHDGDGPMW